MRQKNIKKALAAALLSVAIICSCGFKPQKYYLGNLYPAIGLVTRYNPNTHEADIETAYGWFQYAPPDTVEVGDVVCAIIYTNGTEDVADDYAIKVAAADGWEVLLGELRDWYMNIPKHQHF